MCLSATAWVREISGRPTRYCISGMIFLGFMIPRIFPPLGETVASNNCCSEWVASRRCGKCNKPWWLLRPED